ncbi:GCN5-related N-acetyltransferase [Chthoniobacter flavus Ellin428]|uniref:GCN5-related N-acetyltransferase n=1 Tax=Chthoniobacter flavus Ellin428 TaxID=497964 RepID=B4D422_9BACT|nr:GNAT family N-acetyltransferase [Chthoniobacter flavus]EDY19002.1 GCN5-related N-acetyltransferase [Chthoniobacter flavus Ellin428]TCO93583.1 putative acetyltransferase [Chthoniobacter flavus]
MNPPTIAPATTDQIPALAALFEAQLREHDIDSPADGLIPVLQSLSEQPQHGFILCATCDGAVVGVAYAACILSLEHSGWSGWLEELYVLPEWRGSGLGSRLLDAVIAGAKERRWMALDLEVDSAHQRVISLYARRHFQPLSRTRFALLLRDGRRGF